MAQLCQQTVLENSAAEGNGLYACVLAYLFAGGCYHISKHRMEGIGKYIGLTAGEFTLGYISRKCHCTESYKTVLILYQLFGSTVILRYLGALC